MPEEILVRLPSDQLPGFDPQQDQLGLAYVSDDVVVLRRRRAKAPGTGGRDFLRLFGHPSAVWAGDLFHALNLNHASGLLRFVEGDVRREVYLKNGEIIFAQSNRLDDRLGESLVRAGKITQRQLDDAAKLITRERKLGKILVDEGLISPKELFLGVRRQVEEIVWSLFDWPARFVFYEGFADPASVIALNLETHKLLVDGIRRSRLWQQIPVEAPERDVVVHVVSNPKNLGLNQAERRIVALAVQGLNLRDLVDQSGMGVLETYKVVHHLIEREVVAVAAQVGGSRTAAAREREAQSELERTIRTFQGIFGDIIGLLRKRVQGVDVVERLNSFFDNLPPELAAVFAGVRFGPDGALDIPQIVANVEAKEGAAQHRRGTVLRAFNELLYFTLFEMKNFLSDEDTGRIMEIIEHMEVF